METIWLAFWNQLEEETSVTGKTATKAILGCKCIVHQCCQWGSYHGSMDLGMSAEAL